MNNSIVIIQEKPVRCCCIFLSTCYKLYMCYSCDPLCTPFNVHHYSYITKLYVRQSLSVLWMERNKRTISNYLTLLSILFVWY